MIGTHDSYTFLKPKRRILEYFSFLWRTQVKNIREQKRVGVSYFDIRVRWDSKVNKWRVCHGYVDFNLCFDNLEEITSEFSLDRVRIILERGKSDDESKFKEEIRKCLDYPSLSFAGLKKGWRVIINRDEPMEDFTYIPFYSDQSFWKNIKGMRWMNTIKNYAKKNKPDITEKMIKDEDKIYFIDYA